MRPNNRGAGRTRNLGMPNRPRAGGIPDLNGRQRGLGYGGAMNPNSPNYGGRQASGGGQPDYFAQFNAWTDPNIGGQQPGPLQRGYGGISALGTMDATKLNGWLNTFQDPIERARAMNGIGYNNFGNPYTPQVQRGTNQWYRDRANSGEYTAPGTYLHQSSYTPGAGGMPNMNFGGYIGATNIGEDLSGSYSPFDINARGRGRTRSTRTFGQVAY